MTRQNEDRPDVVVRVADGLRSRRESGILEQELCDIAEREGVWTYQLMEALNLSNRQGIFMPRQSRPEIRVESAGRVIQMQPGEPDVERVIERAELTHVAIVHTPPDPACVLRPTTPRDFSKVDPAITPPLTWPARLEAAIAEQFPDAPPNVDEVVIPLNRMAAFGWPTNSMQVPAFWAATHAGTAARALGWDPRLRDGVGLVLRRLP